MLRINVGAQPPPTPPQFFRLAADYGNAGNVASEEIEGDPFAGAGPPPQMDTLRSWQQPPPGVAGDPNLLTAPPAVGSEELPGDPFAGAAVAPYVRDPHQPLNIMERFFGPGATHAVGGAMNEWQPGLSTPEMQSLDTDVLRNRGPLNPTDDYGNRLDMGGSPYTAGAANAIPPAGTPLQGSTETAQWSTLPGWGTDNVGNPVFGPQIENLHAYDAPHPTLPPNPAQLTFTPPLAAPETDARPTVSPTLLDPDRHAPAPRGFALGQPPRGPALDVVPGPAPAAAPTVPPLGDLGPGLGPGYTPPNRGVDPNYPHPYSSGPERDEVVTLEDLKRQIFNAPVGTGQEVAYPPGRLMSDGTVVTQQQKGTVPYDPQADNFGGEASNWTLLKSSLVPWSSAENLEKRIQILAADLGVPPSRFFTHNGQIKYVDLKGNVHPVAPSWGGGTWRAPGDLLRRLAATTASEAGQGIPMAAGMAAGAVVGPEGYHITGPALAALGSMAGDYVRQQAGSEMARQAGWKPPPGRDDTGRALGDVDWWNILGQGFQNAGYEFFARMVPPALNRVLLPGFGWNPYKLRPHDVEDMARLIEDDAAEFQKLVQRYGSYAEALRQGATPNTGQIARRAAVANELKIALTPSDLLQVTDDIGHHYMGAVQQRLHHSLLELEVTVASASSDRGRVGAGWMRNFYNWRNRVNYPAGVGKVLDRISPETSPAKAFDDFATAAGEVMDYVLAKRETAGLKAGWGELFDMGRRGNMAADVRPVLTDVRGALERTGGAARAELLKVQAQLQDPGIATVGGKARNIQTPVTNYERLHGVRMHLEQQLEELALLGKASKPELEALTAVRDSLVRQLRQNPLYEAGDAAWAAGAGEVARARATIVPILKKGPKFQEELAGPLAQAGPTRIAAARRLFEEASAARSAEPPMVVGGGIDALTAPAAGGGPTPIAAWNALVRGYLQQHMLTAGAKEGGAAGLQFANKVHNSPHLRMGLLEMVTDPQTRELLDGVIDIGFTIDQRTRNLRSTVMPKSSRLTGGGVPLAERIANWLEPRTNAIRNLRARAQGKQEQNAVEMAVDLTKGGGAAYKELRQTFMPLGGRAGTLNERMMYGAAPFVQELTDYIPRPSPIWAGKTAYRLFGPPIERDVQPDQFTAEDLVPHEREDTGYDRLKKAAPGMAGVVGALAFVQWQQARILKDIAAMAANGAVDKAIRAGYEAGIPPERLAPVIGPHMNR